MGGQRHHGCSGRLCVTSACEMFRPLVMASASQGPDLSLHRLCSDGRRGALRVRGVLISETSVVCEAL